MTGKNYLNLALESEFGVAPATGWRGVAVEDLGGHKIDVRNMQPKAMIYGQQGPSTRGRRTLEGGAKGMIKTYLSSTGILAQLRLAFGEAAVTELVPDAAYQYVFSSAGIPSDSIAVQLGREFGGGGQDRDTLVGGQASELRFAQTLLPASSGTSDEGLAKLELDVDYRKRDAAAIERLPTYPDPELYNSVGECKIQVGPDLGSLADECLRAWAFKYPTGLVFDDPCVSSVYRNKAARVALPMPSLDMEWTYKTRDYMDAYLAGDVLAMRASWQPTSEVYLLAPDIFPSVTIDIPAFQLTGDTPEESADNKTTQKLPADVLWNETDEMVTVTVVTSEADY